MGWDESKYERDERGRFKAKYSGQAGRNHRIRAAEASQYILEGGARPDWVKPLPEKGRKRGGGGRAKGGGGRAKAKANAGARAEGGGSSRENAAAEREAERRRSEAAMAAERVKYADEVMALVEGGMDTAQAEALVAEKAAYRNRIKQEKAERDRKASR